MLLRRLIGIEGATELPPLPPHAASMASIQTDIAKSLRLRIAPGLGLSLNRAIMAHPS